LRTSFVALFSKQGGKWLLRSWNSTEKLIAPSKIKPGGTYVHVINGTSKQREFFLFREGDDGKGVRIPESRLIDAGKRRVWALPPDVRIANKDKLYKVGLASKNADGTQTNWGIVDPEGESKGMVGSETDVIQVIGEEDYRLRHIVIKPIPR
ncbi:MAG: hypothetical protein N2C14_33480, partial [Planctomycetales bacterium]